MDRGEELTSVNRTGVKKYLQKTNPNSDSSLYYWVRYPKCSENNGHSAHLTTRHKQTQVPVHLLADLS
ncbi:hypothetical protein Y1Q_0008824 [Alligator mississippiensis]|uniref:Uncharacterized protein n=1 Tax=Alligator mississippiensis TaxID=8496 RepID=A0A151NAR1_ALLMI|nr:hypothetical protein Y1Q_0008824 [Alligator mississippiensis]